MVPFVQDIFHNVGSSVSVYSLLGMGVERGKGTGRQGRDHGMEGVPRKARIG